MVVRRLEDKGTWGGVRVGRPAQWSLRFGRQHLLLCLALDAPTPKEVLLIGGDADLCRGIALLWPNARVRESARWPAEPGRPDLVVASYALSARDCEPLELLRRIREEVPAGAWVAVVDVYGSPDPGLREWLDESTPARMADEVLPALRRGFPPVHWSVCTAWNGQWQYLLFLGRTA